MTFSSDGLLALCAKRINELQFAFAKLSKQPGPQGERGEVGPAGKDGARGERGEKGERGDVGERGPAGEIGPAGRDGARGPVGPRGPAGKDGERGPMPDHEWSGTKLRFQKPDGEWGKFVQLRGPKGDAGNPGTSGGGYVVGGGFDPSDLPAATNATPDAFLVRQGETWAVATYAQMSTWLGGAVSVVVDALLTEDGEIVVTESRDVIIQE